MAKNKKTLSDRCAGFNYTQNSEVCEILNENLGIEELICEAGRTYYEHYYYYDKSVISLSFACMHLLTYHYIVRYIVHYFE